MALMGAVPGPAAPLTPPRAVAPVVAPPARLVPPGDAGEGSADDAVPGLRDEPLADEPWRQVRIEQRLIIRIAPGGVRDLPPPFPPQGFAPPRLRRSGNCVALGQIAAIQPSASDNQIVLMLRDRRQLRANLEKTCSARDFYVGFYAERTEDGQLCARRDTIHSRAGATCMITGLREIGR